MLHVKKEDQVMVTAGKDKGKTGKVLRIFPSKKRVVVENINFVQRHTRRNPQRNIKGGIVEREAPVDISNLRVICRECNKPTRVVFHILNDGKKVRSCKHCDAALDR
jgi:large subunit ribosomal protein L24